MTELDTRSFYDPFPLPLGPFIRVIRVYDNTMLGPTTCDFHLLNLDDGFLYDFITKLPLLQQAKYTALSYTWGAATSSRMIAINGQPLLVRQNLWEFMNIVMKQILGKYTWIDSLCIDQGQLRERSHQVEMMGEIYSRAECVFAWLGCETDLYGSGYWSRAWIVQEFVLAKRITIWWSTTFGSQAFQIDGDALDPTAGRLLDPYTYPSANRVIAARDRHIRRNTVASSMEAQEADGPTNETTLLELLEHFGENSHCADPKDRIYSLLSLLSPAERARLGVIPDYSKSTSDLFTSIFRSFPVPNDQNGTFDLDIAVTFLVLMLELDHEDQVIKDARTAIETWRSKALCAGEDIKWSSDEGEWSSEGSELSTENDARSVLEEDT